MNTPARTVCLLIALILFITLFVVTLAGGGTGKVNLEAAGLAFLTAAVLVG